MGTPGADRKLIPFPYDQIVGYSPPADPARPLSLFQERFILSACPPGTCIAQAWLHRTGEWPSPIWVRIMRPDGRQDHLILRQDWNKGSNEVETRLLPALARLGLPVPTILAGPGKNPRRPQEPGLYLLNVLPGRDLNDWSWAATSAEAGAESKPSRWRWKEAPPALAVATGLVLGGVARLHRLTEAVSQDAVATVLPHKTLLSEMQGIVARSGPWFSEPLFVEAVEIVLPVVSAIHTPPVFSNGDYNPGNFLFDGEKITGFVDFQLACFEDPHIGFAKYWTYDWYPLNKAGLVERYLETQSLTLAEFAPRLAVRCLWTLARGIAVEGGDHAHHVYRERIVELLRDALHWIERDAPL